MSDTDHDAAFDELAVLAGIEPDFWSFSGEHRTVSRASKAKILNAMGFPADGPEAVRDSLRRFKGQFWLGLIGPVHVYRGQRSHFTVPVSVPATDLSRPLKWRVRAEDGRNLVGEVVPENLTHSDAVRFDGMDFERRDLVIHEALPDGYHRLTVELGDLPPAETSMIVAPGSAFVPPWLDAGDRRWGLAAFLPGLRSDGNWGIGDFSDLSDLAVEARRMGASFVGLNPLHALFTELPDEASPYSPSSRIFFNVWHLDVARMEGFSDCQAEIVGGTTADSWLGDARGAGMIDYPAVAERKMRAFRLLFRQFDDRESGHSDRREFEAFKHGGGDALREFAAFEALHHHFGVRDWREWPAGFRDPQSPEVAEFARQHAAELDFHMFLQWQADRQLAAVSGGRGGKNKGVGLYGDLAVGCHVCGADAWRGGDLFADSIRFGAPPDPFNAEGQNWGMAPINPHRLWRAGFEPFVDLMRANMRHAAALRIDHVMSLRRLFWIPEGAANKAGAYVAYPMRDLLAIIALESHRNGCLVIGEDLGTVPEGFREQLAAENVLSYRVIPFERHKSNLLFRPDLYPRRAVVTSGTHDLPPILGHWRGTDIAARRKLENGDNPAVWRIEEAARAEDRELIRAALADQGLLPGDFPLDPDIGEDDARTLILAMERFAARTPAALMMVNLDDMTMCADLLNLPGTILEHPNWRKKSRLPVDRISHDGFVRSLIAAIASEGRV